MTLKLLIRSVAVWMCIVNFTWAQSQEQLTEGSVYWLQSQPPPGLIATLLVKNQSGNGLVFVRTAEVPVIVRPDCAYKVDYTVEPSRSPIWLVRIINVVKVYDEHNCGNLP